MNSSSPVHEDRHTIRAFIQARMSSKRFPGKVLAPLNGVPIIKHVITRVSQVLPPSQIMVLTSDHESDDPLASYLKTLRVSIYRGSLRNVFDRFRSCLLDNPCDWFFRICADSPLVDATLLADFLECVDRADLDVVTNVQPRTFPKGLSIEMIKVKTFLEIETEDLTADEQDHITRYFYAWPDRYNILNIESTDPTLSKFNLAVDSIDDLYALEKRLRLLESDVSHMIERVPRKRSLSLSF